MPLIYGPQDGPKSIRRVHPITGMARHLANELWLEYLAENHSKFEVRCQARHEVKIARRKREWHERQPDYDVHKAIPFIRAVRQQHDAKLAALCMRRVS